MKKILLICSLFFLSACAYFSPKLSECQWSNDLLIGHNFRVVSNKDIREYYFNPNFVVTTIGEKKWKIWPIIKNVTITGPVLKWEIAPDGKLLIRKDNDDIWFSYIIKGKFEEKYFVIENGINKIFERIKYE